MTKTILKTLFVGASAATFSLSAASAADEEKKKPAKKADPAARFAKLDTNSDGSLDADELKAAFKKKPEVAEKMMKRKDKDADGKLSKEEFTAPSKRKKKDGDAPKKEEK